MLGAAVLTCEQLGLSWSMVHLSTLKKHATGKGNAKKPEMHAAAKRTRTSSSVWDITLTLELWTKQVALAASLWEALKRDLPFLGVPPAGNAYEEARLRALLERANRD
jgi:hypothetical protein